MINDAVCHVPPPFRLIHRSKFRGLCLGLLSFCLTAPAGSQDSAPRIEAVRLNEQRLSETVPLTGTVTAERRSQLSAQVEGLVSELNVDSGDRVSEGDLLLSLDEELVAIDRDRARANWVQAREQWRDARRQLDEARSLEDGSIAASEIRSLEAEERVQRASRDAARSDLRRLEAELDRHKVRAPYDAVVNTRETDLGEWVTPGDTLMELVAQSPLRVHFRVPQRHYGRVSEETTVSLRFDAYPGEEYEGRVHRKVPLSETGSRTFLLRVDPPSDGPVLIPGLSTSGDLRLDVERSGIAVPRDALIRYPDGRITVWRVEQAEEGSTAAVSEKRVETGLSDNGWVEVTSGLSAGDVVVTRGNEALQDDMDVRVDRLREARTPGGSGER